MTGYVWGMAGLFPKFTDVFVAPIPMCVTGYYVLVPIQLHDGFASLQVRDGEIRNRLRIFYIGR